MIEVRKSNSKQRVPKRKEKQENQKTIWFILMGKSADGKKGVVGGGKIT